MDRGHVILAGEHRPKRQAGDLKLLVLHNSTAALAASAMITLTLNT